MPAYVRLCLRTWAPHLGDVRVLDLPAAAEAIGPGVFDFDALARFPLPQQKDAIQAAVLNRHGGVFMDADMIVLRDLRPVLQYLERSEFVIFARYLAFIAARPGSWLLQRWLSEIRDAVDTAVPDVANWSALGNQPLERALQALFASAPPIRALPRLAAFLGEHPVPASESSLARMVRRGREIASRRVRRWTIRALRSRQLTMLDRLEWGYVPEEAHFPGLAMSAREKYERFWFSEEVPLEKAFTQKQCVIALHNSWTPAWYTQLDEDAVLAHPCLLSRTLRSLLSA
jgi:hypothetical protein